MSCAISRVVAAIEKSGYADPRDWFADRLGKSSRGLSPGDLSIAVP